MKYYLTSKSKININDLFKSNVSITFMNKLKYLLERQTKLKLLQIVAVVLDTQNTDPTFCLKKLNILKEFNTKLLAVIVDVRSHYNYSKLQENKPLLFKFYVKLCHTDLKAQCQTYINHELEI
eukprot:304410_1